MTADLPRRRSRSSASGADACDRPHRASDLEPHDDLAIRDMRGQLDPVGEVDRVAVVELRRQRRAHVDRARVEDVLDRLPVDQAERGASPGGGDSSSRVETGLPAVASA